MRYRMVLSTAAMVIGTLALAPVAAAACTVDWDGGGGDRLWSTASNWSTDALPGPSAEVCIPALSGDPISVDVDVTIARVAASHPVLLTSGRSLSALLEAGTFTLADGAVLPAATIDGATVLVALGATATLAGGEFKVGTLAGGGEAAITGTYSWTGGRMLGDGVTSVAPGATVTIDADVPNGSPQNYGASIEDDRHLQNAGTIVWADGYVGINDQATMHNAGTLSLQSTTDSWEANTDTRDAALVNTGLIERPSGTNEVSLPAVDNDGVIRVRRGSVEFDQLLQTVDGRIELDLGGPASGTEHGAVSAFFSMRLSGTLAVTLSPGYSPADTDVFHVLTVPFGLRRGTLSALELPALAGGRSLAPAYLDRGLDLTVSAPAAGAQTQPDAASDANGESAGLPAQAGAPPESTSPPAPREPSTLQAVDDVLSVRAARRVFIPSPLANDSYSPGTRVQLVSRPPGVRVRINARTGAMRIRVRSPRARLLRLRYRLVATDSRRSRVATLLIRLEPEA